MVELTNNSSRNYESVGHEDESGGHQAEEHNNIDGAAEEQGGERNPPRGDDPTATAQTIHGVMQEISSTRFVSISSLDRLFLNILALCFLMSLTYAFGKVYTQIPFIVPSPSRSHAPTMPPIVHYNDELFNFHSRRPTPPPSPRGPPPIVEICRPPTGDSNATSPMQQIHHSKISSLFKTDGVIFGVYLSGDASVMVWTDPLHPMAEYHHQGRIRTFGWDCESKSYKRIGYDLNGVSKNQRFGIDVQLSYDGQVLFVKSHTDEVAVFNWEDHQWAELISPVLADSYCFRSSTFRSSNLRTFSMNRNCTTFAIITQYFGGHMQIAVFRLESDGFNRKDYIKSFPVGINCKGDIGLDISEDEVITLFGHVFGIRKFRLDRDRLILIVKSELRNFEFPPGQDITTPNGVGFNEVNFHASVSGNSVLYSMGDGSDSWPSTNWVETTAMVEFRDSEWITLYNDTRLGTSNSVKRNALTPQVALVYDPGHLDLMTVLVLHDGEWREVATHKKESHAKSGVIKLSADGFFVAVIKDRGYFSLYSLTRKLIRGLQ